VKQLYHLVVVAAGANYLLEDCPEVRSNFATWLLSPPTTF
jgi:hypothetical protein